MTVDHAAEQELAAGSAVGQARPMRPKLHRRFWSGLLAGVALLGAGCAADAPQDTLVPEGPAARTIDNLITPIFGIAAVVFVFVLGGILFVALKFRARPSDGDDFPEQVHGNTKLEIGWTVVPAIILAGVSVFTVATVFDLADADEGAMDVEVIGQQWWWEYRYDTDGDGEPDIVTANELVIPAGQPVNLEIQSRDVIHSFWAPALNGKRDAVPGRTHPLTLEADEAGRYLGQCTEYCGLSHGNMRLVVEALPADEFDEWLDNQLTDADEPTEAAAEAGLETFNQFCVSCHQIDGVNEVEEADLVAGAAPNLTHLMTRQTFAGSMFELMSDDPECTSPVTPNAEQCLNRPELEAWLRNPPAQKPAYAEGRRGMPNLGLSEEQIDDLVAYLTTLD
ncbi:cytochrome c oxidase subunit II [soil metagenome]